MIFGSATSGYVIENAIYLDGSADYLTFTPFSAASDPDVYSISMWIKRLRNGTAETFIHGNPDTNSFEQIKFNTDDIEYQYYNNSTGTQLYRYTDNLMRDPTAWFNYIFRRNGNTADVFINGTEVTYSTESGTPGTNAGWLTDPSSAIEIGRQNYPGGSASLYSSLYLAEVILLDGVFLDPTNVGEYDNNGVWVPKDPSELSFGNNGFHLKFDEATLLGKSSNSSTNPTVSFLGSQVFTSAARTFTTSASSSFGDAASNRSIVIAAGAQDQMRVQEPLPVQ